MALVIEQEPAYRTLAAGQEVIYVVSENTGIVFNNDLVKINALVIISKNANFTDVIHSSSYSSTPNNKGVAIFDFGPVLENYVLPQRNGVLSNTPASASTFSTVPYDETTGYHAIHHIDDYALGEEPVKYFMVGFTIEFLGADPNNPNAIAENGMYVQPNRCLIYNGVLYETDQLQYSSTLSPNYGYNLAGFNYIFSTSARKFLSDKPTQLYARLEDYGTFAFFNGLTKAKDSFNTSAISSPEGIHHIQVKQYEIGSGNLINTYEVLNNQNNGGWSGKNILIDQPTNSPQVLQAKCRFLFYGGYPANQQTANESFRANMNATDYYTIQAFSSDAVPCSKIYTINIIRDCLYEPIRLAWLNKYGAWDYYTFMKKSVKTLEAKRVDYHKLKGTWNSATYNVGINKGGSKTYKTETTEKITLNTDFVSEEDAVWFEQLFTSNEVMIVKPLFTIKVGSTQVINRFTEPVKMITNSFTKKNRVNDKLIQYSFQIEKSYKIKSQGA